MSIACKEELNIDDATSSAHNAKVRDIVIITGCNAVGKTSASCYLQKEVTALNFTESSHIADSQFLLEAMLQDDQIGGLHHTHDWCLPGSRNHSHTCDESRFPFTVLDNKLPDDMRTHFFDRLVTLPRIDGLWFVEWAAGVNTNLGPLSHIDYSYSAARKVLEKNTLLTGLLKRIRAVVHIQADMNVRHSLNRRRSLPSSSTAEEIAHGTSFWRKDQAVLQFYGQDDFYNIADLFHGEPIPIYTIINDGSPSFFQEKLANVVKELREVAMQRAQQEREVVSI